MGVQKAGGSGQYIDFVANQLGPGDIRFGLDYMLDPESQVRNRDLFLDPIVDSVDVLIVVAGQMKYRLPHRLAGNGARVDAGPAEFIAFLNNRDALPALRSL